MATAAALSIEDGQSNGDQALVAGDPPDSPPSHQEHQHQQHYFPTQPATMEENSSIAVSDADADASVIINSAELADLLLEVRSLRAGQGVATNTKR